ncbi:hypothetical protein [Streptomyces sp. SBT349]|uniref:hypothetical protein n=1 Tax=Streptomyces sp. SBT349 TaxID=1580539 RepID=UPI00066EDAF2|nr:hypothetical protein [Streptomyces sp. SBT349]
MDMGTARAAASDWVRSRGSREPGFRGAYFAGSTVGLPDAAPVPLGSDIDVMVVTEGPANEAPGGKLGKFRHQAALIEVTHLPRELLADPERVLASYHLAGPFATDTVIADPTGKLARLREAVAPRFAEPVWVRRRFGEAAGKAERGLRSLDPAAPWPRLVMSWLFPTGVATHVLLAAGLRNPTVRLRYVAVRELLAAHGLLDLHEELLALLGSAALTAERAEEHLHALAGTFDAAAHVARTPFPYSSDLTPAARPIAIDASLALIRSGAHREVAFWLAATFARCHTVLDADAPEARRRASAPAFDALLADLGVGTRGDLLARADAVLAHLPRVREAAEGILQAAAAEMSDT